MKANHSPWARVSPNPCRYSPIEPLSFELLSLQLLLQRMPQPMSATPSPARLCAASFHLPHVSAQPRLRLHLTQFREPGGHPRGKQSRRRLLNVWCRKSQSAGGVNRSLPVAYIAVYHPPSTMAPLLKSRSQTCFSSLLVAQTARPRALAPEQCRLAAVPPPPAGAALEPFHAPSSCPPVVSLPSFFLSVSPSSPPRYS